MKRTKPKSRQDRRSPEWLVRCLEREVLGGKRFLLDPAASNHNAVCKRYYTEANDGLVSKWLKYNYVNPGFAKESLWLEKAIAEWRDWDFISCVLGPTGCSQEWFHELARLGTVYAPNARISFCDPATGAPHAPDETGADRDTMIYVFGAEFVNRRRDGWTIRPLDVRGFLETWNGHLGAVGWKGGR
jgi:phage N-6-adenine-methyltransferase